MTSHASSYPSTTPTLTASDSTNAMESPNRSNIRYMLHDSQSPRPARPVENADSRLHRLKMSCWTIVPISDHFAATILTLYLKQDRPMMATRCSSIMLTATISMRFGPWTHNLIAQNIVQITVNVEHRGRFSGVEMAFVSAAEIARWSCGAIWPRPEQFLGLGIASFCVVAFSFLLFAVWAVRWNRRELVPIRLD